MPDTQHAVEISPERVASSSAGGPIARTAEGGALLVSIALSRHTVADGGLVETVDHWLIGEWWTTTICWTEVLAHGGVVQGQPAEATVADATPVVSAADYRALVALTVRWSGRDRSLACAHQRWSASLAPADSVAALAACPLTGFTIGADTLVVPLPDDVVRRLRQLSSTLAAGGIV